MDGASASEELRDSNSTLTACDDNGNDNSGKLSKPSPLPFYSQYSQLIRCPSCAKVDYHFVKPFDKHYELGGCYTLAT